MRLVAPGLMKTDWQMLCCKQSGLSVPNRTVPYIPPLIRFGSRSILPSASRTYPLYGTVRFILRAGYGDSVRFDKCTVRFDECTVWLADARSPEGRPENMFSLRGFVFNRTSSNLNVLNRA